MVKFIGNDGGALYGLLNTSMTFKGNSTVDIRNSKAGEGGGIILYGLIYRIF